MITLDVNPAVRGISKIMEILSKNFPDMQMEPFSQVSLRITFEDSYMLQVIETLDGLALFYTEVK